jgi:hypothetical protein
MNLNPKQRKTIWICLAVAAVSYCVHSAVLASAQASYIRQVQAARQQAIQAALAKKASQQAPTTHTGGSAPAPVAPTTNAVPVPAGEPTPAPPGVPASAPNPAPAPPPLPDPIISELYGVWSGTGAISGKGLCTLSIEIRQKAGDQAHLSGYPSLTCRESTFLTSKDRATLAARTKNIWDPESAILTGTVANGTAQFSVDKTIGTDSRGCGFASMTLTPFGTGAIDAAWLENGCEGGHVLLRKVRP